MRKYIRSVESLELVGGLVCLDFTNTIKHRYQVPIVDYLSGMEDWLIWAKRSTLITDVELKVIQQYIQQNPTRSQKEFHGIIRSRESIHNIFNCISRGEKPLPDSLQIFTEKLHFSFERVSITIKANRKVSESWSEKVVDLLTPLVPIVKSAYELLNSDKLGRVKECDNCGWLYLDKSKNNSRKWCSMLTCGSSDKARRYYRKTKNYKSA